MRPQQEVLFASRTAAGVLGAAALKAGFNLFRRNGHVVVDSHFDRPAIIRSMIAALAAEMAADETDGSRLVRIHCIHLEPMLVSDQAFAGWLAAVQTPPARIATVVNRPGNLGRWHDARKADLLDPTVRLFEGSLESLPDGWVCNARVVAIARLADEAAAGRRDHEMIRLVERWVEQPEGDDRMLFEMLLRFFSVNGLPAGAAEVTI